MFDPVESHVLFDANVRFTCTTAPPKALLATLEVTTLVGLKTTQLVLEHRVRKDTRSNLPLKAVSHPRAYADLGPVSRPKTKSYINVDAKAPAQV